MNKQNRHTNDELELPLSKNGHHLCPVAFSRISSEAEPALEPKKISLEMRDLARALFLSDPNT